MKSLGTVASKGCGILLFCGLALAAHGQGQPGAPAAPTVTGAAAVLTYAEASSKNKGTQPNVTRGGGLAGGVQYVADSDNATGHSTTTTSNATATLSVELTPVLNRAANGTATVTLKLGDPKWAPPDASMAPDSAEACEDDHTKVLSNLTDWSVSLTTDELATLDSGGQVTFDVGQLSTKPFGGLRKLHGNDVKIYVTGVSVSLTVVLTVDDAFRKAQEDKLNQPINELKAKILDKQRELDQQQANLNKAQQELQQVEDRLQAATNERNRAKGVLDPLAQQWVAWLSSCIQTDIDGLKSIIANNSDSGEGYVEKKKRAQALLQTITAQLDSLKDGSDNGIPDPNFPVTKLDTGDNHIGGVLPRIEPSYGFMNKFNAARQAYAKAAQQSSKLENQRKDKLGPFLFLQSTVDNLLLQLDALKAQLAQLQANLTLAKPTILQVDVSIAGDSVYEAVYNTQDAETEAKIRDLNNQIAAELAYRQSLLQNEEDAKKAFFDEENAAVAASNKLSGLTGSIMVDALADARSKVGQVITASVLSGGPWGGLAESLKQVSESMSGEGFKGVDEKKIEQAVAQGGNLPSDGLEKQMLDWSGKKAISSSKDKGVDTTIDQAKAFHDDLLKITRDPNVLGSGAAGLAKNFVAEKLMNLPNTLIAMRAKAREEAQWKEYFEHELRAQMLCAVYKTLKNQCDTEKLRFDELLAALEGLKAGGQPVSGGFRTVFSHSFSPSEQPRTVGVTVTTQDLKDPSVLSVVVGNSSAQFVPASTFNGTLAPGIPEGRKVVVRVHTP